MGTLWIMSKSSEPFQNRKEAADSLAKELMQYQGKNPLVLGIPRGGAIIAYRISKILSGDFDILLAHKLGAPDNPELAIGAVTEEGKTFIHHEMLSFTKADRQYIEDEKSRRLPLLLERNRLYRQYLDKIPIKDRIVIVADDGIVTGSTMQATLRAVRQENPQKIIAAFPVGPAEAMYKIAEYADETFCLQAPPEFGGIGAFYTDFAQVEDSQLIEILQKVEMRRSQSKEAPVEKSESENIPHKE